MSAPRSFLFLIACLSLMSGRALAQYGEGYDGAGYGQEEAGYGQEGAGYGDESAGRAGGRGDGLPDPGASGDDFDEGKEDRDPMNWIGVGLKAGVLYFGDATLREPVVYYMNGVPVGENRGVPARVGALLSLPINLGGAGFGWVFDPYLGLGDVGSYGIYSGPTITLHLSDMTYFGIGIGVRFGVITQDFWGTRTDLGFDVYGRVPVVLTYYVAEQMGLLLDMGFGLGGTYYRPTVTQQQVQPGITAPQMDMQFGFTYQVDASAGVRFP